MNVNEGVVRYQALIDAGEYEEARAYADKMADEYSLASDAWLERANVAQFKQSREEFEQGRD